MSGPEEDLGVLAVLAQDVLDDLDGVRGRHAVVGERLDLGRRVDVHDRDRAGVLRLPGAQLLGRDRVGQRAARVEVGDQHGLVGREDRRRLGHEVHAAEGDDGLVDRRRAWDEAERVAHVVGDVLDLGQLVVVGQDDRVALAGERADLGLQRPRRPRAERPLGRGGRPRGHGEVHGRGSRSRERSRAGAECVSAPTETKSTPVPAISRTVSSVTPPLASSFARPSTRATIAPQRGRRPCCRAAAAARRASSASSTSSGLRHSTSSGELRAAARAPRAPPRRRRRPSRRGSP